MSYKTRTRFGSVRERTPDRECFCIVLAGTNYCDAGYLAATSLLDQRLDRAVTVQAVECSL